MVNGLASFEQREILLRLETARRSVLGRPVGYSLEGILTDRQSARSRAAHRNGSWQWPAPDPKRRGRAGRRVGPGKDGGSQGRAYNAHGEGHEDRPQTGPPRSSKHHTMALPARRLRVA